MSTPNTAHLRNTKMAKTPSSQWKPTWTSPLRANEKPTFLTRRQILASGVAMAGAIRFLPRAAAAPETGNATLRLTAGTRTPDVIGKPAGLFGLVGPNGQPG